MKKTRLGVHIDGDWYSVSDRKLHKISRPGTGYGGGSQLHHRIAGADKRDASTQITLQSSVGNNMKGHTTESSTDKKPTKKIPSLFNTLDRQGAEITRRRKSLKQGGSASASGGRENHRKELQIAPGNHGLWPQSEPSHEIGDADDQVYDNDESSCMSTAASAIKCLMIKIRISKEKAWHLLGVNP